MLTCELGLAYATLQVFLFLDVHASRTLHSSRVSNLEADDGSGFSYDQTWFAVAFGFLDDEVDRDVVRFEAYAGLDGASTGEQFGFHLCT